MVGSSRLQHNLLGLLGQNLTDQMSSLIKALKQAVSTQATWVKIRQTDRQTD